MELLKNFGVAFGSFIILDFLWLGFVVKDFNLRQLAEIGRIENGKFILAYLPTVLVYVLMAAGVVLFVLPKVAGEVSVLWPFLWGALLGFIVYGVYDMTNLAILKNYPIRFAMLDIAWGTLVFGIVTVLTVKI